MAPRTLKFEKPQVRALPASGSKANGADYYPSLKSIVVQNRRFMLKMGEKSALDTIALGRDARSDSSQIRKRRRDDAGVCYDGWSSAA